MPQDIELQMNKALEAAVKEKIANSGSNFRRFKGFIESLRREVALHSEYVDEGKKKTGLFLDRFDGSARSWNEEPNPSDIDLSSTESCKVFLREANFARANLFGANFSGSDLRIADFSHTNFVRSKLVNANLERANLEGASLHATNLEGANLRDANLRGASLTSDGSPLAGLYEICSLKNACLVDADLSWAQFKGADLTGADLRGANLDNASDLGEDILHEGVKLDRRTTINMYSTHWLQSLMDAAMEEGVAYAKWEGNGPVRYDENDKAIPSGKGAGDAKPAVEEGLNKA